jgi:hypothetical protein
LGPIRAALISNTIFSGEGFFIFFYSTAKIRIQKSGESGKKRIERGLCFDEKTDFS